MDLIEIIKSRRSIRKFRPDAVPQELVEKVLEAGRWAPSGLNNQPWRFALITSHPLIDKISKLTHYSKVVLASRVLIPVFLETEKSYHREKDIQAIGACLQNMLLEAHSVGLGGVWLGEIIKSDRQIRELMGLSGSLELMAVLALGYPDEHLRPTKRKDLQELIVFQD
jgi:nitroreductase